MSHRAHHPVACVLLIALTACGSGGGTSGSSRQAPDAPTQVAATADSGRVTVTWTAATGATGYRVYWSPTAGVDRSTASASDVAQSPFVHTGLGDGTRYYYVVTARNDAGESPPSSEVSAVPGSPFDPAWASAVPAMTRTIDFDGTRSASANGAVLASAIAALRPGEKLEIGSGTWSIDSRFTIDLQGTAAQPIWIVAKDGAVPVITRPNANQNAMNVGSYQTARYLLLRGLEVTGGDTAIKLYACDNVWIDGCHVHHCGGAGIAANSADTVAVYLTRNHIHDTAGTAEGLYLGANNGQYVMRDSVIARNHIHDTYGNQGDGIELKQGSYNNWIVENFVHDCHYPCILAYGTGGKAVNVIERNVCYRSGDNVMQVQGEAIVRNNLLIAGANGFHTHDHQGQTRNLTFVHNTILTIGRGADLVSWNGREGMVFANNVVYSRDGVAVRFSGSDGVQFAGNVVRGAVIGVGSGWIVGGDLSDFVDVDWNGDRLDAMPMPGSAAVDAGDARWGLSEDLLRGSRDAAPDAGCFERR